jgi:hypothetical protein
VTLRARWVTLRARWVTFQGYDREADKETELKRLTGALMEMEDRLAHYEKPSKDDTMRLPPVVSYNTTTL